MKFRVWHRGLNRWKKDFVITPYGSVFHEGGEILDEDGYLYDNQNDFVIQQFTGLSDITGKPIFEGDIITVQHYDSWFDEIGFLVNEIVYYNKNSASFVLATQSAINRGYSGGRFDKYRIEEEKLKVIGNIMENPEILK